MTPKAALNGLVYCRGGLENRGAIQGAVYTNDLMYSNNGILYSNHFVEGSITDKGHSHVVLNLPFIGGNQNKKIMQWLY